MLKQRHVVPAVAGVVVFGAVTAFAAGFSVSSTTIQAGSATVGGCGAIAAVTYNMAWDPALSAYKVSTAPVTTGSSCKSLAYKVTPDVLLYPDFDDNVRQAFRSETELFFASIVRENRSVLNLLDADYTFVNERLARHYGIPGVRGEEFRRVGLAGTPRAGVLTHASVLTVTSGPTRTSPVKRGKWLLENVLGDPVPSPPPGVDDLKALALEEAGQRK